MKKSFYNLFIILLVVACKPSNTTITNSNSSNNSNLPLKFNLVGFKIKDAIKKENEDSSVAANRNYKTQIDNGGLYPNRKHYALDDPKIFYRAEKPDLSNTVEYYYSKNDSIIRAISYEWNDLPEDINDLNVIYSFKNTNNVAFDKKFNLLQNELTKELGEPVRKNIESNTNNSYRDDFIWYNNGSTIYLFMFGNKENGYRQIRMIIYKD